MSEERRARASTKLRDGNFVSSAREPRPDLWGSARENRQWFDREPLGVWAPIVAVILTVTQSFSYFVLRFFYAELFGVTPEEVGSDYTTLLARNALPLGLVTITVLFLLTLLVVELGFFVRFFIGMDERANWL